MRTFKAGIHMADKKDLTSNLPIEQMPIVPDYYVCLRQHIGGVAIPVVKAGDVVSEGQLIAKQNGFVSANVHSPVSGTVVGVEDRKTVKNEVVPYIHIKSDGAQKTVYLQPLVNPTSEEIIKRVGECGIVGHGGAGFPTAVKLSPNKPVDTLIINAAECEPYLNSDNRIMIERTDEFLAGVKLIAKALNISNIIIGIEANKMEAYNKLVDVDGISVGLLKKKYPQGAEKMLIYALTKKRVPRGGLPMDVGVIVNNVETSYAVYQAVVNGKPSTKKVTTVSGEGIATPKMVEVRIGTPWQAVVDFCGGAKEDVEIKKIIAGGPMMGQAMDSLDYTTTKTDGAILFLTAKQANTELPTPCIKCGKCVDKCPMFLEPLYIDFYATVGDYESAAKYGAKDCMECGVCASVCPARRPIVQSVQLTKNKLKEKNK